MRFLENWKHVGLIGGGISLIGTLPFGVLNVLAFTIGAKESVANALFFSFGVIVAELIVVACCLKWLPFQFKKKAVWEFLQYLMVGFLFFLAFQQIRQIGIPVEQKTDLLSSDVPRFFLGLGLSIINPSQFPFWITWNGILGTKGLLQTVRNRWVYLIGIGIGTFSGLSFFILASQLIGHATHLFHSKAYYVTIAAIFALTGILLGSKLVIRRFQNRSN